MNPIEKALNAHQTMRGIQSLEINSCSLHLRYPRYFLACWRYFQATNLPHRDGLMHPQRRSLLHYTLNSRIQRAAIDNLWVWTWCDLLGSRTLSFCSANRAIIYNFAMKYSTATTTFIIFIVENAYQSLQRHFNNLILDKNLSHWLRNGDGLPANQLDLSFRKTVESMLIFLSS